eukprot:295831-Rhodomonas_salina.1
MPVSEMWSWNLSGRRQSNSGAPPATSQRSRKRSGAHRHAGGGPRGGVLFSLAGGCVMRASSSCTPLLCGSGSPGQYLPATPPRSRHAPRHARALLDPCTPRLLILYILPRPLT